MTTYTLKCFEPNARVSASSSHKYRFRMDRESFAVHIIDDVAAVSFLMMRTIFFSFLF